MRFRHPARTLLVSTLWTLPGAIALPHAAHAKGAPAGKSKAKPIVLAQNVPTLPKTVLITAVRGSALTLAVGADEGAKIGQTFRVTRGDMSAKLQITAVTGVESTASIIAADPGFIITVGESATYVGEEALAPAVPDAPVPANPATPQPATPQPATPTDPTPPTPPVAAANPPQQAILTGVTGKTATLGIGIQDGAVVGAVYALPLDGDLKARLQITRVGAVSSQATLEILEEGFLPTVGDTTRFVKVEAVVVPAPPAIIPAVPVTPAPPTDIPAVATTPIEVAPAPVAALSGSTATVTSVQGQTVTISAGSAQGARTSLNLPILRSGTVIGLLRLQVVGANSSSGVVLWRDETLEAIAPGDAVGILGAPPEVGNPVLQRPTLSGNQPIATPVRYETGASNIAVPKAERTYELLASLASSGLIESQRASVFQDDGARRHRTAEDIIFTRAQVAGFIREAISNYDESPSQRNRAALGILTQDFRRDLLKVGETDASLARFKEDGLSFGLSGFSRYAFVGGTDEDFNIDPYGERYGAQRSRSGYDTRTNLFGKVNSRLSFYGSFDYGNDQQDNAVNQNVPHNNLQVRKAYVSYDASNLLRGLKIDLGRKEFWWGPGQFGTTILGDTAGGLNSLSSSFERGSYKLEGLYAYLGPGAVNSYRSLYGQRITLKVSNSVSIGTNSTILSPDGRFDAKYFLVGFTPLPLYAFKKELNGVGDNDNSLFSGFAEASVAKGARVYGEILIDDLSNRRSSEESLTGSIVGLQLSNPRNPAKAGFKAEYARFNSLTYLGPSYTSFDYYYQFRNSPLGYPVTPLPGTILGGAESLRFEGYYSPLKKLRIFGGVEYTDVNTGDENSTNSATRGFSRQQTRRIAIAYDLSRTFSLTLRGVDNRTDQPTFFRGEATQRDKYASIEIGRSF